MKAIKYFNVICIILLFGSCICCGSHGRTRSAHSSEDWQTFQLVIRETVKEEIQGVPAGGGFKSWNDRWKNTIKNNKEQGSPKKYVDFIIDERRRVGLPELRL